MPKWKCSPARRIYIPFRTSRLTNRGSEFSSDLSDFLQFFFLIVEGFCPQLFAYFFLGRGWTCASAPGGMETAFIWHGFIGKRGFGGNGVRIPLDFLFPSV